MPVPPGIIIEANVPGLCYNTNNSKINRQINLCVNTIPIIYHVFGKNAIVSTKNSIIHIVYLKIYFPIIMP